MAFSFRKMLSNITYFKSSDGQVDSDCELVYETDKSGVKRRLSSCSNYNDYPESKYQFAECNLANRRYKTRSKLHSDDQAIKYFAATKTSVSDSEILEREKEVKKPNRRSKKLRLDVDKANQTCENLDLDNPNEYSKAIIENTPKHLSLGFTSEYVWPEIKALRSNNQPEADKLRELELLDAMKESPNTSSDDDIRSDESSNRSTSSDDEDEPSDDELRNVSRCKKVGKLTEQSVNRFGNNCENISSDSSFSEVECENPEDDRITLLLSYQMKLEKLEHFLKTILSEFRFHVEVSQVFKSKTCLTTLQGCDVQSIPRILGEISQINNVTGRLKSNNGSWSIYVEKEDAWAKSKMKQQLLSIKCIVDDYLNMFEDCNVNRSVEDDQVSMRQSRRGTFKVENTKLNEIQVRQCRRIEQKMKAAFPCAKPDNHGIKKMKINNKKRDKRIADYPDLRDAFYNLFSTDGPDLNSHNESTGISIHDLENTENNMNLSRISDVGLTDDSGRSTKISAQKSFTLGDTITSGSLCNFSINNSSTYSACSKSIEDLLSYCSFNDGSPVSHLFDKTAMERITFYSRVHKIQMKSDTVMDKRDLNDESTQTNLENDASTSVNRPENRIIFTCVPCSNEKFYDENSLVMHILEQNHCERLHFTYKIAYINRCNASRVQIEPSTILNPMTMYRDANKIVCFGESRFACSLCYESNFYGESVLIAHCNSKGHVAKKELLLDVFKFEF